jgi:hypothetical protein
MERAELHRAARALLEDAPLAEPPYVDEEHRNLWLSQLTIECCHGNQKTS